MKLQSKLPLIATMLVSLALTACGGTSDSGVVTDNAVVQTDSGLVIQGEKIADKATYDKAKTQTLTLYSGDNALSEGALIDKFTADTGIKVKFVGVTTSKLAERVLSEQGAGKLGADVIRLSDYRLAKSLEDAHVWKNYEVPGASKLEGVVIDGGQFHNMFNQVYTFGYNTKLVSKAEAPKSWKDLVSDQWKGKIGIVQGGVGGSMAAVSRFMEVKLGSDYMEKYASLKPGISSGAGDQTAKLARGEVAVATIAVSPTFVAAKQDNAPITFVIPEEGIVTYPFYLGKASSASNVEAAEVFMNYNFSRQGQSVFTALGEYSVRPDVPAPNVMGIKFPPYASDQVFKATGEDLIKFAKEDLTKWNRVFGYTQ